MEKYICMAENAEGDERWLLVDAHNPEEAKKLAKAYHNINKLFAINTIVVNDEPGVSHSFILDE
ncbi:hypothetical protein DUK53_16860 [Listeria sp. SHR_NRA_18]|uniref:hypothetical protein n=1 Tax=Listeria sp. SHR_NRA_18 TaxID=2269046 RepID=UPI000F603157|nr:hypothetical protein [Listeria sp. SHR_NRA_18]RQW65340.1 hypothetical protein DUK53_16860 [Listeria sp. SHR_NRA_18]